ncbi:MAG: SigB/SigF/SigG family RNA polymerase sigma factor, partial [Gaiellaceae bacterium]
DVVARDELFERYEPLARKLARRYAGREPLEDLVQVASLALLKAIDRFDPERGTAFSSLAVPTILGELKRYFRDVGWFAHVPRGMQELTLKVQEARTRLSATSGRSATAQDLAAYLELPLEDVVEALYAAEAHHASSIDVQLDDGLEEGATLLDTLGAEDERFAYVEDAVTIAGGLSGLSKLERRVLGMYFLEELTQAQIGQQIGVSQMQVSRILRRATDRLRELTAPEGGGIR